MYTQREDDGDYLGPLQYWDAVLLVYEFTL